VGGLDSLTDMGAVNTVPESPEVPATVRGQSPEYFDLPITGWVAGYGFGGSLSEDATATGLSYAGGGVQTAFGYLPSDRFAFGLFYDFGVLALDHDLGDEASVQTHSWGGYVSWHRDADYFLFLGGGGFANYHSTRHIRFGNGHNSIDRRAESDHMDGQAAFYGEYGRNLWWENARLRPYLGLLYMTVGQGEFQESGADSLDLLIEDSPIDSFRTLLGGQFDFRFCSLANLVWTLHGVWMHEYVSEATRGEMTAQLVSIPGQVFVVSGPDTGRDWLVAGGGVRGAFFEKRFRPFANYDLVASKNQFVHTAWGGVEYVW
jgi:outer membrane autotransporter protein